MGKSAVSPSSKAHLSGVDSCAHSFPGPEFWRWMPLFMAAAVFVFLAERARPGFSQNLLLTKSIIGIVTEYKPEAGELKVKPDDAAPVSLKLSSETTALKVAPGEKDLKKAATVRLSDLSVGDRVLVTLDAVTSDVRRIIVMSSADIAKQEEAERQDWVKRGISGIVTAKANDQITLSMRGFQGPVQVTVRIEEHTKFKRYATDSVKFSEAKPSNLQEVNVGDQLRARGRKSEDGLKVAAEEVVFGTFLTKAGSIASINSEAKEITVRELGTGKLLVVKLTSDSQLKKMQDFGGGLFGAGRSGFPAGRGDTGARGASGAAEPGRGPMSGAGGQRDIGQMLERMPATTIAELKSGESVVFSSTKDAQADQLTAIMLVSNADALIRMASMQSGANRGNGTGNRGMNAGTMGQMDGMGGFGGFGGAGGFELPGMIP